jgi:hypothetical protein
MGEFAREFCVCAPTSFVILFIEIPFHIQNFKLSHGIFDQSHVYIYL